MKSRMNIVVAALVVVIGVLLWTVIRDRKNMPAMMVAVGNDKSAVSAAPVRIEAVSAVAADATGTTEKQVADVLSVPRPEAAQSAAVVAATIAGTGQLKYTAQPGDTVSNLAATLPGGDRKINRDAVISANPSLQNNPDRVLAGKTYEIPAAGSAATMVTEPMAAAGPAVLAAPVVDMPVAGTNPPVAEVAQPESVHELKYTARTGDTVSTLAGALLGSDSKENRDTIIGANASLQNNPDRMIAEKSYRIPVKASQPLAAAPASETAAVARPTTQPDADSLVIAGSARELRYVAQAGDNVSILAAALLGSDTKENRAAITDHNESLKRDPDRVVAGQTYWIPAPAAGK